MSELDELKAENETLKKVKDFACINLKNYIADNNNLKAENERLKQDKIGLHFEIKQLEQENFELKESLVGQRNAYKKLNSQYIENCEYTGKLEQTLQEIKAIAERELSLTEKGDELYDVFSEILQILTKVEEE